jgi:cell wall-associated NlpC family hydrolase
MTGVAPIAPSTGSPSGGRPSEPVPGFSEALTSALQGRGAASLALRRFVTLGQMTGTTDTAALVTQPEWATAAAPPAPRNAAAPTHAATGVPAAQPVSGTGGAIVQAAKRYLGVPYRWGGTNPATGLDCSGFTQRVFKDLGIAIPRVSVDQSRAGTKVADLAAAQPGDLVFRRGSPNHIGIYLGDGQFIHAPRTGDVVKVAKLTWTPTEIRRMT